MKDKAINIMTLTCKAGFDCSTGQIIYKQVLSEADINRDLNCEGSLFIACVVPLNLTGFHKNNGKVSIWRNKSSSIAFCRPLRFAFNKESKESVLEEDQYIKSEIEDTSMIVLDVYGSPIKVKLVMIDGKIQTILSGATNSSQCCSVCIVSPKIYTGLISLIKNTLTEN